MIIPFAGGTSVSLHLQLSSKEKRMIVSLDMCRMNKIKHIDRDNEVALVEAGIVGKDLEKELK